MPLKGSLEALLCPAELSPNPPWLKPLNQRIQETASWCASVLDMTRVADSLRSKVIRPRVLEASYSDAVWGVATSRQHLLGHNQTRIAAAAGKLMVYFPDGDLADGAAEAETGGYFDTNNAPPWDTWVTFAEDSGSKDASQVKYLLAWVPQPLVALVDLGIQVNPEECIKWLRDTDVALSKALSSLGRSTGNKMI